MLFNLLNALAISDTQQIQSKGELVDLCQRIGVLDKYEKIILKRSSLKWFKQIISVFPYVIPQGKIVIRPNKCNEILTIRSTKSSRAGSMNEEELQNLNNNSSQLQIVHGNNLKGKLEKYSSTMDPIIMKQIRNLLEERCEKQQHEEREAILHDRIRSMENQLKMLTDLILQQRQS